MGQQVSVRYTLTYPVSVLYSERTRLPGAQPRVKLQGQTHDLSMEGMGLTIEKHHSLHKGQDVTVVLHYGDINDVHETLSLLGQLVWSKDGRMGVKLLQSNFQNSAAKVAESRHFYFSLLEGFQSLNGLEPVGHLEFDS